ncbi:lysoplasmalogenase family protein [uncultured Lacinutrix sp.]|uniref:lysoplasmalogenase family protein n=1 Tax=uncultured Lacinutrix sp. TaxID=574032 RepID=UPI0026031CFB|nr:lysoplasmalogenase family protein [uncultured Lacinutrix sp.]
MQVIFKNKTFFTTLFFAILLLDIFVKLNLEAIPFRFITKPIIVGSLIIYYLLNNQEEHRRRFIYMCIALSSFLIGDILLIFYEITNAYIIGILLFIIGKLFYAFRFSNEKDFNLTSLMPYFIICFIYMVLIMLLVIDNLGDFFIPAMVYLFASLIVILFAFLRKNEVIKSSYLLVIAGVFTAVVSDSISLIQSFYYENFPFHEILIMLVYGISQYLIVMGITNERKIKEESILF